MNLYKADEIKIADNNYVNNDFLKLTSLITRAGESVCDYIPEGKSRILIMSGTGNNGADGIAAACLLIKLGYDVTVWLISRNDNYNRTILYFLDKLAALGKTANVITTDSDNSNFSRIMYDIKKTDVIIDAIFGTGFKGEILPIYELLINYINEHKKFVLSIDIPSGVNGDTGAVLGVAIKADLTITFCNYKIGNLVMPGKFYSGKTVVCDIGMPSSLFEDVAQERMSLKKIYTSFADNYSDRMVIKKLLCNRNPYGHKGDFGKVLIIAGSLGMSGAAQLCARATLKSGAGLCYLASPRKLLDIYEKTLPEIVKIPVGDENSEYFTLEHVDELHEITKNMDVVVIGPGIGRNQQTILFAKKFIKECKCKNLIIDADALYAYHNDLETLCADLKDKEFVITPHDGEFSLLTGEPTPYKDRLTLVRKLSYYLKGNVLLKGNSTVISDRNSGFTINLTGNSGMATAGSGDVLAGIIAGILASNNVAVYEAAYCGAYIHGLSGDIASEKLTEICVNATDIIENLPNAYKKVIENV